MGALQEAGHKPGPWRTLLEMRRAQKKWKTDDDDDLAPEGALVLPQVRDRIDQNIGTDA